VELKAVERVAEAELLQLGLCRYLGLEFLVAAWVGMAEPEVMLAHHHQQ
jgi:hypothetical protein